MYGLPEPGTIVAGKYRVENLLGEGGMSSVFRAHHELMDKPVALKWLRPELSARPDAKDRFMREARTSARIKHPNVVDVHDVGVHDGALFLVMELLEGESFAELIDHGNISIPSALRLLIGAMEGVATAHEHGIVHRDIKPENIFVVRNRLYPNGIAKILDFGISKLTEERGHGGHNLTKTGHTVGTPEYMSMEQMTGEADVDARADVYSFGVLLYRALTGAKPFSGETFAAIAVKVATTAPIPPRQLRPELPAALEQVVMKAMARDREHRYPSMRALIDALSFLGSTQGFLSHMPNPGAGAAPLLTPTPQGLRDLLPFSNFRADTVELGPPTKALTDANPVPRPRRRPRRNALPTTLGLAFLALSGVAAWRYWPGAPIETPAGDSVGAGDAPANLRSRASTAAEDPRAPTAAPPLREQDRPLAQPRQDKGPVSGTLGTVAVDNTGEWDSHPVAPVQVQVEAQPPAETQPFESNGAAARGESARSARRRREPSSARSVAAPSAPAETAKPASEPAQPSGKSATGRRSGTLRSDDF